MKFSSQQNKSWHPEKRRGDIELILLESALSLSAFYLFIFCGLRPECQKQCIICRISEKGPGSGKMSFGGLSVTLRTLCNPSPNFEFRQKIEIPHWKERRAAVKTTPNRSPFGIGSAPQDPPGHHATSMTIAQGRAHTRLTSPDPCTMTIGGRPPSLPALSLHPSTCIWGDSEPGRAFFCRKPTNLQPYTKLHNYKITHAPPPCQLAGGIDHIPKTCLPSAQNPPKIGRNSRKILRELAFDGAGMTHGSFHGPKPLTFDMQTHRRSHSVLFCLLGRLLLKCMPRPPGNCHQTGQPPLRTLKTSNERQGTGDRSGLID